MNIRICVSFLQSALVWFGFMVLDATFNNISAISWRSVLLVEETGGPGENHRPVASHWQTLSHNVVHLALIGRAYERGISRYIGPGPGEPRRGPWIFEGPHCLVYSNYVLIETNRIRQLMKSSPWNNITNITHTGIHMEKSMPINESIPVTITHVKEQGKHIFLWTRWSCWISV